MERIMKFRGKYYIYAESDTKQRIQFLAEGFSSKGVPTLIVQGDGQYHLFINDNPRFWTGINGAPSGKVNPWFMYIPPGTYAKPDTSKWKAEIHYVDSKGRVTKAKDFGAVAHHVSPSGRTIRSVMHSDRKPGPDEGEQQVDPLKFIMGE